MLVFWAWLVAILAVDVAMAATVLPRRALRVAAISLATTEDLGTGTSYTANWDHGLTLATIALEELSANATKPELVLLPETFATGYPPCCDLRPYAEVRSTSRHLEAFRRLSAKHNVTIVLGFLEHVSPAKGVNWYGAPVQNAAIIFDGGMEVGVHYKTRVSGCGNASHPPVGCRDWRDETRLLVPGDGIEIWRTRLGKFAIYTCSENMAPERWSEKKGLVDFIVSPYNCEESNGTFVYPDVRIGGRTFPQRTCNTAAVNSPNSQVSALPSVWANRVGSAYVGGDVPHYIANRGTAGGTDKRGKVVARTTPGVEEVLLFSLPLD